MGFRGLGVLGSGFGGFMGRGFGGLGSRVRV